MARVCATLPAVFLVMMVDSLSKEPHGAPLYLGTAALGVGIALVIERLLGIPRPGDSEASVHVTAIGIAIVAGLIVAGGVFAWLFTIGH